MSAAGSLQHTAQAINTSVDLAACICGPAAKSVQACWHRIMPVVTGKHYLRYTESWVQRLEATARTVSNSPVAVSSEHAYEAGCLGLQEFRGSGV